MVKRIPITPGDLTDHQWGTDDILTGVASSSNTFYGDAGGNMSDHSKGGDDTFTGGVFRADNLFYGDAGGNMSDHSKGGNDAFTGGSSLALDRLRDSDAGRM